MQGIDFLPQRYREAHAKRSRKLWGVVVVLVYAGLLSTSGYLQKSGQQSLKEDLAAANAQRTIVTAQAAQLAALQAELKQADARAGLIVYLRHPWPRTQIVAAVVGSVTRGLSLEELRIQRIDTAPMVKPLARPRAASPTEEKKDDRSPAQRDWDSLREMCDASSVIVTVKGSADEVSLVHEYLGRIDQDPLFASVDLVNIDGQEAQRQGAKGCRFTARLEVRPGYGQPHGPTATATVSNAKVANVAERSAAPSHVAGARP